MNVRQAGFLHHEVPGIIVPESVRTQLASSDEKAARHFGMRLAEEIIAAAFDHFPGV
jgi:homocysteine S-methyltransferase